jgi:lysophospholipase L1-like esterase
MKKRIVCFGDSNTWGYDGESCMRFDEDTRWTGVLAHALGEGYTVIEEGQNGRTTVWDDPVEGEKNGLNYLGPCLESHKPFDLIVIMLGTNDLKSRFNVCACEIAESAGRLVKTAMQEEYGRNGDAPKVLLVSPIHTGDMAKSRFSYMFRSSAMEESKKMAGFFLQIAEELGCGFFDAASVARPDKSDLLHMDAASHKALGSALAGKISAMLE